MINDKNLTKIISASLMGDGYINKITNKNSSFCIELTEMNVDHIEYLEKIINECGIKTYKRKKEARTSTRKDGTVIYSKPTWFMKTESLPYFTKFRERMYPLNRKTIDSHYLKLIDWESLAIWYQEDGFLERGSGYIWFCTEHFSELECYAISKSVKRNLNLELDIKVKTLGGKRKYRLKLWNKQNDIFRIGVMPFMSESFKYKLDF